MAICKHPLLLFMYLLASVDWDTEAGNLIDENDSKRLLSRLPVNLNTDLFKLCVLN